MSLAVLGGGGALAICTPDEILIRGVIEVLGGAGGQGAASGIAEAGQNANRILGDGPRGGGGGAGRSGAGAGGGGGSGGLLVLVGQQRVSLTVGARLEANGGVGGRGSFSFGGGRGGFGVDGGQAGGRGGDGGNGGHGGIGGLGRIHVISADFNNDGEVIAAEPN